MSGLRLFYLLNGGVAACVLIADLVLGSGLDGISIDTFWIGFAAYGYVDETARERTYQRLTRGVE